MTRKSTTPANATALLERISLASEAGDFGARFVPCAGTHPWSEYCSIEPLTRFAAVFRWMFPIYGALHLVPAVLFKRAQFFEKPGVMLRRATWGTIRSSAFLGAFVAIFQGEYK